MSTWKPIPGWEDCYEVSSAGVVRSVARLRNGRTYGGRIIAPFLGSGGYLVVNLTNRPLREQVLVHRAVLLAFRGAPGLGQEACHNDGTRTNNDLANLRWGTHRENHADKWLHGTAQIGERSSTAKLTEGQVRMIRSAKTPNATLAKELGVKTETVRRARAGETWKHL